jgi:hypothetical protein
MTAINFSRRFAAAVRKGEKRRTIRRTQRANKGDRLQLYTGMRTKSCRKLGEGVCTKVTKVVVREKSLKLGAKTVTAPRQLTAFAKRDGHETWESLTGWLKKYYGLPFTGWLHEWKPA